MNGGATVHVIKTDGRSANDKANDWWLCWDLGIYRGQPLAPSNMSLSFSLSSFLVIKNLKTAPPSFSFFIKVSSERHTRTRTTSKSNVENFHFLDEA